MTALIASVWFACLALVSAASLVQAQIPGGAA